MPGIISDLSNDESVKILAAMALGWVVFSYPSPWILLRGLNLQRVSEFPRILRWPLFGFLIITSVLLAFPHFDAALDTVLNGGPVQGLLIGLGETIFRALSGLFLWLSIWPIIRFLHVAFIQPKFKAFGSERQRNTATVVYRMATVLAGTVALVYTAWLFNLDLAGYVVAFGGVGVALAFSLQTILKNMLAGISLALEVPFSVNDLIRTGDDRLYQVMNRGLDITTLRDINTHEIVYMPNGKLADDAIVDVTRPTDDLRSVIELRVQHGQNLRDVRTILTDIANGHPNIIGAFPAKQTAIVHKVRRLFIRGVYDEAVQHFVELGRLKVENDLNESIVRLRKRLENWASFIDNVEQHGFDRPERVYLEKIADELKEKTTRVIELTTQWQVMVRNASAASQFNLQIRNQDGATIGKDRTISSGRELAAKVLHFRPEDPKKLNQEFVDQQQANHLKQAESLVNGFGTEGQRFQDSLRSHETGLDSPLGGRDRLSMAELWSKILSLKGNLVALVNSQSSEIGPLSRDLLGDTQPGNWGSFEILPTILDPARLAEVQSIFESDFGGTPEDLKPATVLHPKKPDSQLKEAPEGDEPADSGKPRWDLGVPADYADAALRVHIVLRAADFLRIAGEVPTEISTNRWVYRALQVEMSDIGGIFTALGNIYTELLMESAGTLWTKQWRYGNEFSMTRCKTRTEDSYESEGAVEHLLDHPLFESFVGTITDDDTRHDLADMFALWGDKTAQLEELSAKIESSLREAKSTTIDTKLRELAEWVKLNFKDPFPAWKYPVAPVDSYDESAIRLSVKFYVDNVRMERYQRPFSTYTQFRLRLVERLENAGIQIPYSQHDIHIHGNLPAPKAAGQANGPPSATEKEDLEDDED